jgi:hypothetical protein
VEIRDQDALGAVAFGVVEPSYAFVVNGAHLDGEDLNLEIVDRLTSARLRVALPRTGRNQYWIYVEPDDAADWASQLFLWIEEEVRTGGMWESRVREIETREGHSESYVIAEPYGWRLSDPDEHARLLRAVGGIG